MIHELRRLETKAIETQPRLKKFNLNLVLTCNKSIDLTLDIFNKPNITPSRTNKQQVSLVCLICATRNRSHAACSFNFEITSMISDQGALHAVQLPLFI